jgi:hypothetical protein
MLSRRRRRRQVSTVIMRSRREIIVIEKGMRVVIIAVCRRIRRVECIRWREM